uniref:EOG090X04W0 n=1 Tax=Ceriodaphnia reticulata TaxID=302197 RepID=A0A4Y7LZR2_9CRUS|nr:EOG090X04W0 [Ceriodaphnia reticulata]SVE72893.1 EOG090X04W0 [Ceriodaphnia reticulata]
MRFNLFITVFVASLTKRSVAQYQVRTDEVFVIQLSPASFNLSDVNSFDHFTYAATLQGLPDLPKWINIVFNPNVKLGFLYGTPPNSLDYVKLDLVASNVLTYETSSKEVTLEIFPKEDPADRQIQMKIHNLNLEDLMDEQKQVRLLDVFRKILWPESSLDLHLVELYSALAVGGRRPARRQDGEGVILTLGSNAEFSEVLRELEREVSPLWPLRQCPRDFKKTSSERYFRSKGFLVDWCSFKLLPQNTSLLVFSTVAPPNVDSKTERITLKTNQLGLPVLYEEMDVDIWSAPTKWEIPRRSYTEEGVVAIFIPLVVLLLLAALLTAVLGVHPEGAETEEGQLYEGVFEELPFLKPKQEMIPAPQINSEISTMPRLKATRACESTTPSLSRVKRNPLYDSMVESVTRGSSPFLMSSGSSPSPTPVSTLSRSAFPTPRSTLGQPERISTLGRPEPPPYANCGTLNK